MPWRQLLWVDCLAGATAGTLMLTLHRVLASWYGVPVGLLLGIAGPFDTSSILPLAQRRQMRSRVHAMPAAC